MGSFANADPNLTARPSKNQIKKSSHLDQIDFRDRFVIADLPDFKDAKVDYKKL
jgi:hypothetical protein